MLFHNQNKINMYKLKLNTVCTWSEFMFQQSFWRCFATQLSTNSDFSLDLKHFWNNGTWKSRSQND